MMRRLPRVGFLALIWVALWEDLSAANVASGVAVAAVVVAAFPGRRGEWLRLRPLPTARFFLTVLGQLVAASAVVAWEVVTPRNKLNQAVVAVPLEGDSELVTTIVANMISLTPGTLTIEVHRNPTVLYVHVMHLRDVNKVRADMRRLESLALDAFGMDGAGGSPPSRPRVTRTRS